MEYNVETFRKSLKTALDTARTEPVYITRREEKFFLGLVQKDSIKVPEDIAVIRKDQ